MAKRKGEKNAKDEVRKNTRKADSLDTWRDDKKDIQVEQMLEV